MLWGYDEYGCQASLIYRFVQTNDLLIDLFKQINLLKKKRRKQIKWENQKPIQNCFKCNEA